MGRWVTSVGASVYNMAGDANLRPNVMGSTITSHILSGSSRSIGDVIQGTIKSGNASRQRRFFKWAQDNYSLGVPTAQIGSEIQVDDTVVTAGLTPILGLGSNQHILIEDAYIDDADAGFWVEEWIDENHPNLAPEAYTYSFDDTANQVVIDVDGVGITRLTADADLLWGVDRSQGRKLLYTSYRIITENADSFSESPITYFTYRMGTGNVSFDTLLSASVPGGEFFPPVPIRLHNVSADHTDFPFDEQHIAKAYKRLTGGKLSEILTDINEHESVGDMDHVFIIPGVTFNTEDQVAREYLYRFFTDMMQQQRNDKADFKAYIQWAGNQNKHTVSWERWQNGIGDANHPTNNQAAPVKPSMAQSPTLSAITIQMPGMPEFHHKITWAYIHETIHHGNAKTFDGVTSRGKLKKGEYWLTKGNPLSLPQYRWVYSDGQNRLQKSYVKYGRTFLFQQVDTHTYKKLEITNLSHTNYVYGSHSVHITANEAIDETEESSFLVPLHEPTLRAIGLVKGNQLATANTYMMVNAYHRRKKKWYERGFFKIIIIAVGIALSLFTGGASLAASTGIAITAAAGITLGATMTMVVGAIVNQVVAMVVSSIIMKAATSVFGDKLGTVIGTIASFAALSVGVGMLNGESLSSGLSSLFDANNLIQLTTVASDAYTEWLNLDTAEIIEKIQEEAEGHEGAFEELEDLAQDVLGMTNIGLDPILFTDLPEHFGERSESFLTRTLLTAQDLQEISQHLIDNFAEISLELPDPIR